MFNNRYIPSEERKKMFDLMIKSRLSKRRKPANLKFFFQQYLTLGVHARRTKRGDDDGY